MSMKGGSDKKSPDRLGSIIAMPVGNEVSLWKTEDNGTRRIDLMLTDVIGDSTDFSHLNDSRMVEKLREKVQAMVGISYLNIAKMRID